MTHRDNSYLISNIRTIRELTEDGISALVISTMFRERNIDASPELVTELGRHGVIESMGRNVVTQKEKEHLKQAHAKVNALLGPVELEQEKAYAAFTVTIGSDHEDGDDE